MADRPRAAPPGPRATGVPVPDADLPHQRASLAELRDEAAQTVLASGPEGFRSADCEPCGPPRQFLLSHLQGPGAG
jgi:hypothetical protein